MHHHCFANFRRRHSACPSCSQDWPREAHEKPLVPVGEGAARDGDDGKRRARIKSTQASEDEEPTEEDEPQTQRKSQRTKKGKAPVNESMDMYEDNDEDEDGMPEASQTKHRSSKK